MAALGPSAAPLRAIPRGRSKLRVGVFADSASQPRWLVESLARLAQGDFAELAVVCVKPSARRERPLLWQAYRQLDRALFARGPDPLKAMRLEEIVPEALRLPFAPGDPQWRARMACLRLDVAVAIGDVDEDGLEDIARYGVWRHCFGTEESPVVASGIRVRLRGADRLACRSFSGAIPFSLARSHERILAKAADSLPRALKQLHEHGEAWLDGHPEPAPETRPADLPDIGGVGTLGVRVAQRTLEHCFTVGQWMLAYGFTGDERWDGNLEGFHRLVPPADRFWADPFPLSVNGRHYIFFEELMFATGKGHISVVEVDERGNASQPQRVLERDYHLSYPFLLEHDGALYMIPESAYDRSVQLFRCVEFPHRWRRERVLVEGAFFADATLARDGGRWWMFTTVGSPETGADDDLHLFSASDLFAEWKPHPRNPVKSDVRSARPAGALFRQDGKLHRPAQICAPIYGSGIAIHRVERLDEHEYAEEEARRLTPDASRLAPVLGMHTINRAGALSVTDLFARRRRF